MPKTQTPAAQPKAVEAIKQPVVQPPVELTVAHFTRRELDVIRKACRDSDFEDAALMLSAALLRGDGR